MRVVPLKEAQVTSYGDKIAVPATRLSHITLKAVRCPVHHPKDSL